MTAPVPGTGFRIATGFLRVEADDSKARRDTDKFLADTDRKFAAGGRSSGGSFGLGLLSGLRPHFVRIGEQISELFKRAISAGLQLTKFGLIAGVVAAGVGEIASAIAGLIPLLSQLVNALVAASGSALLLPPALIAAGAAFATLKIGLSGFGTALKDAFSNKEGLQKQFADSLARLAPAARDVVKEIVKLKPALTGLKLDVQSVLFSKLALSFRDLGRTWVPLLNVGLKQMAASLNGGIRDILSYLVAASTQADWATILKNSAASASSFAGALRPLLRILTDVSTVGSAVLAKLAGGLPAALDRFANKVSALRKDGGLADIITGGLDALKQFGGLLVDVGGIFKGIFSASGTSNGLFSFFDRLNKLINSASGQTNLGKIFESLSQVGTALMPVLAAVLAALVPIANGLATIAIALGPGLTTLVTALGSALASLATPLAGMAPIFAALAAGLQPLANIITGFLLGFTPGVAAAVTALGSALSGLAPTAAALGGVLGGVLGQLIPVLVPIAQILAQLILTLAPGVLAFLSSLAAGLAPLVGVAPLVGKALSGILAAIAPLLEVAGPALAYLLGLLAVQLTGLVNAFGPLAVIFAQGLGEAITDLLPGLMQAATLILPLLVTLGARLAASFAPLVPVLVQFVQIFAAQLAVHIPIAVRMFEQLFTVFAIAGDIIARNLLQVFVALIPVLPQLVVQGLALVEALFRLFVVISPMLPGLAYLGLLLTQIAVKTGILQLAIELLTLGIQWATGVVRMLGAVIELFVAPVDRAKKGIESFGATAHETMGNVAALFRGLGSTITNAVGNLGSLLYNAGRNVVQGLINGIKDMFGNLGNIMGYAAQIVRDHWPFSPARRGPLSGRGDLKYAGRNVLTRIGEGMAAGRGDLARQVAEIAGMLNIQAGGGLAMAGAGAGATAGAGNGAPAYFGPYHLQLADQTLASFVIDAITGNPVDVAEAVDAGNRTRAWADSGRKRIGAPQ